MDARVIYYTDLHISQEEKIGLFLSFAEYTHTRLIRICVTVLLLINCNLRVTYHLCSTEICTFKGV